MHRKLVLIGVLSSGLIAVVLLSESVTGAPKCKLNTCRDIVCYTIQATGACVRISDIDCINCVQANFNCEDVGIAPNKCLQNGTIMVDLYNAGNTCLAVCTPPAVGQAQSGPYR